MMSDQAVAFLSQTEYGEIYQCRFCGHKTEVPHGFDVPECDCPTSQILKDEITGYEFGEQPL